jgi:hypothetical protein
MTSTSKNSHQIENLKEPVKQANRTTIRIFLLCLTTILTKKTTCFLPTFIRVKIVARQ